MRIAVIGGGGTGGYFGGLLVRAGEDVTFVVRGATLAAMLADGLTVHSRLEGTFTVPVQATDDPASVGYVDLILFCVKAYDIEVAAAQIRPLVGPDTVLLSVQNGIDNEERISAILGDAPVIGAVAGVSARITSPGVIVIDQEPGFIRFGELAGGTSSRTEAILRVLERASFDATLLDDIQVQMWEKFVFICGLSGVTSLVRLPVGPILGVPETTRLYRGVMEEVATVGRAQGISLPDERVEHWFRLTASLNPETYGSMYHDLAAGRRLELNALNGTVVRLGQGHGISTPLNGAIVAALMPYADGAPAVP